MDRDSEEELGLVLRTLGTTEDARATRIATLLPIHQMTGTAACFSALRKWFPDILPRIPRETLAADPHAWVGTSPLGGRFHKRIFVHGFKVEGCREAFFREWGRMIDFVVENNTWPEDVEMAWAHREELFWGLLGLAWYCECLKDVEFRPYIAAMRDRYWQWAETWIDHRDSAKRFARFLTWRSAQDIAEEGLVWLHNAANGIFRDQWDRDELEHAVMDCLEHFWQNRRAAIRSTPEVRSAFMGLLKQLADLMFPRALELQDVIAR